MRHRKSVAGSLFIVKRSVARAVFLLSLSLCGPGAASANNPPCEEWLRFSQADRIIAMRAFLNVSVPTDLPTSTLSGLRSIDYQIADHATDLCKRDGGSFTATATTAIATAIEYCQTR